MLYLCDKACFSVYDFSFRRFQQCGERNARYCDDWVCLSVCLSARITGKQRGRTFTISSMRVACGRGRSSSDGVAIRYVTSGFVDDVVLTHWPCIPKRRWNMISRTTKFCSVIKTISTYRKLRTESVKSAIHNCLDAVWRRRDWANELADGQNHYGQSLDQSNPWPGWRYFQWLCSSSRGGVAHRLCPLCLHWTTAGHNDLSAPCRSVQLQNALFSCVFFHISKMRFTYSFEMIINSWPTFSPYLHNRVCSG